VIGGELISTWSRSTWIGSARLVVSGWFNEGRSSADPGTPSRRHPWNKVTLPKPQARDFADKYSWVASPRMEDKRTGKFVANDTGGGPFARQWVTAKAGLVTSAMEGEAPPDGSAAGASP
jgi:hydrogenase large subunit